MPHPPAVRRRTLLRRGATLAVVWVHGAMCAHAQPAPTGQGVELSSLRTLRSEGTLSLDFTATVTLPRPVEEALSRGVPIYFVAEATLWRKRWYWRDERVARVSRQWRIAFQPLTGQWRVALGGLNQNHASLAEALSAASRSAGWKIVDLARLDADKSYRLEFEYRLDASQLPSPMQFGLVTQGEWAFGVTRVITVE